MDEKSFGTTNLIKPECSVYDYCTVGNRVKLPLLSYLYGISFLSCPCPFFGLPLFRYCLTTCCCFCPSNDPFKTSPSMPSECEHRRTCTLSQLLEMSNVSLGRSMLLLPWPTWKVKGELELSLISRLF